MHDYHANETICNEAHKTLVLLLDTMASNLKPIQFFVCSNLFFIQTFKIMCIIFLFFCRCFKIQ